jgi:outer membrane protein OmpA-like peptidoglycan-associated protein
MAKTKGKPLSKGTKTAIGVGVILLIGGLAYWLWKKSRKTVPTTTSTPKSDVQEKLRDVFNNLNFETAKDVILPSSYPYLDELAGVLLKAKNWTIKIVGHTDNQGSDAYNLDLSLRRANSVKRYLVGKGVAETSITTEGKGESMPLVTNDTKEGRATNRRVEFVITKPDNTVVTTEGLSNTANTSISITQGTVTPPSSSQALTTNTTTNTTTTPPASTTGVK